jgi:hypothetical protein
LCTHQTSLSPPVVWPLTVPRRRPNFSCLCVCVSLPLFYLFTYMSVALGWYVYLLGLVFPVGLFHSLFTITIVLHVLCGGRKTSPRTCNQYCHQFPCRNCKCQYFYYTNLKIICFSHRVVGFLFSDRGFYFRKALITEQDAVYPSYLNND